MRRRDIARKALRVLGALPAVCCVTLVGTTATGQPSLAPEERRQMLDAAFVEKPVLEALERQNSARVLVQLAIPAAARAPAGLRWSQRAAERSAIESAGARVLAALPAGDFELHHRYRSVPALAGSVTSAGLRRLFRRPEIVRVARDVGGSGSLREAVPHVDLDLVQARYTGAGVTVAVIDSGVDTDHPDLSDDLVGERCFCMTDGGCCPGDTTSASGPGSAEDDSFHGTAVTGIITSRGLVAPPGGAPDAKIVSIRVMAPSGFCCVSDPIAALDYVLNERPDVDLVNMSIGLFDLLPADCDDHLLGFLFALLTDQLRADGVLTFASAGNDSSGTSMTSPACVSGVISVGAVSETEPADEVASWSNTAATLDLLAPGTSTVTTDHRGGASVFSGTSAATPLALACAATLLEANPALGPDEIELALESSSTRVADPKNGFTFPRVDCEEAHAFVHGACADEIDNDRDGSADFPTDSDCRSADDPVEGPDFDLDDVADGEDNCLKHSNRDQIDSDLDGYGNICDADYDNNGAVGISDFNHLRSQFDLTDEDPKFDPAVDANSDGAIGIPDFNVLRGQFGGEPGPSGLGCAGTAPCP